MITFRVNENMWEDYLEPNVLYCFTTNGSVKNSGELVMGRGTAKQVADMHPGIPAILGDLVCAWGNMPYLLPHNLCSFPTKFNWKDSADKELIKISFRHLVDHLLVNMSVTSVKLPLPGAGLGNLSVDEAKIVLEAATWECDFYDGDINLEVYYYE